MPLPAGTLWQQSTDDDKRDLHKQPLSVASAERSHDRPSVNVTDMSYCDAVRICCRRIREFGASALVVSLGVDTLGGVITFVRIK